MRRDIDVRYTTWRLDVLKRSNFCCEYPNCLTPHDRVQAHHKKPWAKYPGVRFSVTNGIALCKTHHAMADRANRVNSGV